MCRMRTKIALAKEFKMWVIIGGTTLVVLFGGLYLLARGVIKEINLIQLEENEECQ